VPVPSPCPGRFEREVKAALLRIAEDETRHAELASRILAWCREQAPNTRSMLKRVLGEGVPAPRASDRATPGHLLSPLLLAVA
jgi:hypothetical protein